jgi:uncharacterized protein with von Willebrand factor type A (vWA) domain
LIHPEPPPLFDNRLVVDDAYDRDAFRSAMAAFPKPVEELRARGARLLPHFEALIQDLFATLFKLVVQVLPEKGSPPSTRLNRRILSSLSQSPEVQALREETALDAIASAQAALAMARKAIELVRSGEVFLEEELLDLQQLAKLDAELASKKAAEALSEEAGEGVRRALARQVAEDEERRDDLAERIEQSLEQLPARFDAELARQAEQLGPALEETEANIRSFSQGVGGEVPTDARSRLALAEKLRSTPEMSRLAAIAGAFRTEARAARRQRRPQVSQELFRLGRGDDLAHLLPVELSALSHPLRRRELLKRFVERDLAVYDLQGTDKQGRGPVVICVDGSGSMSGERDLWAKGVTLALLDIARSQKRRAQVIVFAGPREPLKTFDLTRKKHLSTQVGVNLEEIISLAEHKPGGGTDFERPLRAAGVALTTAGLRRGDVIFITDGEAPISPAFEAEWRDQRKKQDFAVHALVVDDPGLRNRLLGAPAAPSAALELLGRVADNVTTVSELTARAAHGVFRAL